MTSLDLTPTQVAIGCRPLAGRVLLELEAPATMDGSIHIPQTAQTETPDRTQLQIGRVLAIGYGPYWEGGRKKPYPGVREGDINAGDRVLVAPLLKDLNKRVMMTAVTRIEAILEENQC